ncbi:helix-turn-helix transcriptional regulator [Devosia honganensis]|uniref:Helix-turn-helix transcriptional regulator n=1 Tax=Devosia honganensis TaxID=1610527 RepID=A0ABV7X4D6_9HYPH
MINQKTLLPIREICKRTRLSRSAIFNFRISGQFSLAICLGRKRITWVESDIDEWIEQRVKQNRIRQALDTANK